MYYYYEIKRLKDSYYFDEYIPFINNKPIMPDNIRWDKEKKKIRLRQDQLIELLKELNKIDLVTSKRVGR